MSSFGTQKVPTTNLNVGFPDPYSHWYANTGRSERYMPERPAAAPNMTAGTDFQAQWHHQKMLDANYMANAKVASTQAMNARAFSSPNGYYRLPPAVLGQRMFANPSMGYLDTASTRQDQPSNHAPFHEVQGGNPYVSHFQRKPEMDWSMEGARLSGGVLRTTVGQDWAKAKLNDRIQQFNAIDLAKQAFQTDEMGGLGGVPAQPAQAAPFAGAEGSLDQQLGVLPQVELAQLLQNVIDALLQPGVEYSAITRFVVGDANKIFALCVRLATNNSADDIMNALEFIEGGSTEAGITQLLANIQVSMAEDGYLDEPDALHGNIGIMVKTLHNLFSRLEIYLKQMLKLANSPARDRAAASKTLIKSLGFLKLIKTDAQLFAQIGNANTDTLAIPTDIQRGRPPQFSGAFIAPSGREEVGYFPYSHKVGKNMWGNLETRSVSSSEHFTRRAPTRENTQMGYVGKGGEEFSEDYRGAFGNQSGKFFSSPIEEGQYNLGGREIGWSGAEALAEEGGDEEGEEGEELAQAAASSSSAIPGMRSVRDNTTGGWDIGMAQQQTPQPTPQKSLPPSAARSSPATKTYKNEDVPRDRPGLIKFITQLEKDYPSYSQAVYRTSSPQSIRLNTLRKMAQHGLI